MTLKIYCLLVISSQGWEKNMDFSFPSDKKLSNIATPGQVLVYFFFIQLADNLPEHLPTRQVRIKSHFPGRQIYLSRMTGGNLFFSCGSYTPHNTKYSTITCHATIVLKCCNAYWILNNGHWLTSNMYAWLNNKRKWEGKYSNEQTNNNILSFWRCPVPLWKYN